MESNRRIKLTATSARLKEAHEPPLMRLDVSSMAGLVDGAVKDMCSHRIRKMRDDDRGALRSLLDAALGVGFWNPASDLDESAFVSVIGERLTGVATGGLETDPPQECELPAPVGYIRLVAVDPAFRHRGVATALVAQLASELAALGAASLASYAWVHAPEGVAPLARSLERAGFGLHGRIERFYAGFDAPLCPACSASPCICPADLYCQVIRARS